MAELKKAFRPEFLNRIDDIVVYNAISENMIIQIVDILLEEVTERLRAKNITVSYIQNLKTELARIGYDSEFGARPPKLAIIHTVINPLSLKNPFQRNTGRRRYCTYNGKRQFGDRKNGDAFRYK